MLSVLFGEQFDNFRHILEFYLEDEANILDVTYGSGKLWQTVNSTTPHKYNLIKNDIDTEQEVDYHLDFEDLEQIEEHPFDAIIYDPPYKYDTKSFSFNERPDYDWKSNKSLWKLESQIGCARILNTVFPKILKSEGLVIVKIMDVRVKGRLIQNHQLIIKEFTNLQLLSEIIYVRLGVGVFKNKVSPQTAHGYYLIFENKYQTTLTSGQAYETSINKQTKRISE